MRSKGVAVGVQRSGSQSMVPEPRASQVRIVFEAVGFAATLTV